MQASSIADVTDGGAAGPPNRGQSQPAGERLQQLCQGLSWILGHDAPQQPADLASPNRQLQAQAGRILHPHLEAGLRELTEVLRQDLLVRIAYVQQLERLTELEHDASSLSRLLQGQSRPSECSFDWESAPLREEKPDSPEATQPPRSTAAASDVAPHQATTPSPSPEPAALEADLRQAAELWRQGDEDRGLALCSRIIQQNPAAAAAYLLRGQMHAQRRQHEQAIADFTSAIAICPHHAKAYLRRGNLLFELGKLDQARQGYSTALELQPDLAEAYLRRGLIHLRQKAWQEAAADASAAIRLQPSSNSAYFIRASASFQQGDWQRALADLNHLLQREPSNVLAYNERGLVLASRGEYAQALADYARALRLKPSYLPARYNRALALVQQGELNLALAAFTELIQLAPDNAMAYYQRARIYQARREIDRAVADCEHSLKLQPQFKEAEARLHELRQLAAAQRRELPSPPTIGFAADTAEEKEVASLKKKPASAGKPADDRPGSQKEAAHPSRGPANAPRGYITLQCEECGTTAQVGIDRLHCKFQCRKCGRVYTVRPDGRLTEIVRLQNPRQKLKASIWKGLRLSPVVCLLLLAILGGWYGWRSFVSARALPALPTKLEPRAEMLVKSWLSQDAERMQLLTIPAQEDRIDAWMRANSFPLIAEELNTSRTWLRQTKIEIYRRKEEQDRVQLQIRVSTPASPPVNLEQQWIRIGKSWYFQPFPDPKRNVWQSVPRR